MVGEGRGEERRVIARWAHRIRWRIFWKRVSDSTLEDIARPFGFMNSKTAAVHGKRDNLPSVSDEGEGILGRDKTKAGW